jgi:nucleoside-diphosphate-sugar epimerase
MNRVLITGGAGYIGSILVKDLLDANYQVTVLDNFQYKQNSLAHLASNTALEVFQVDICSKDQVNKFLKQDYDWYIPLAAIVGAPACKKNEFIAKQINNVAQVEAFNLLPKSTRIIMPTTNSAYGTTTGNDFVDERYPLKPISLYASDKVEVEKALMERGDFCSFRLATVFGMSPRMRMDLLVNDFVRRALKDHAISLFEGHFMRNFVHVRDVSRAFLFSMTNWQSFENQIFNVGHPNANISKLDLARLVASEVGDATILYDDKSFDADKRNYRISNDKIISKGFEFKYDLIAGIRELKMHLPPLIYEVHGNV